MLVRKGDRILEASMLEEVPLGDIPQSNRSPATACGIYSESIFIRVTSYVPRDVYDAFRDLRKPFVHMFQVIGSPRPPSPPMVVPYGSHDPHGSCHARRCSSAGMWCSPPPSCRTAR